jgi:dGTPase
MDLFGETIKEYIRKEGDVEKMDLKDRNLLNLLPEESRRRMDHSNSYSCMIVLVDYIAGMTDRFALDLYQRLCGHSPAIGRMG